jgi:hypothetical protein
MKAVLIYHEKERFQDRYLMEMTIHQVGQSNRYPDGVKYGLLLLDTKTGRRVLMDNHHPKGPHVHLDETESPYEYKNDEKLIEDFKAFALSHTGVEI